MKDLKAKYRIINRRAIVLMSVTLVVYGTIILYCWLWLKMKPNEIVTVSTILFQFGVIGWGLGYIFRYFEATALRMDVSIELGHQTVDMIDSIQGELKPILDSVNESLGDFKSIVSDTKTAIADVSKVVREVKERDLDTVREALGRVQAELDGEGKLHRMEHSLKRIANSLDKVPDTVKKVVDEFRGSSSDIENMIAERVDRALGDVFGDGQDNDDGDVHERGTQPIRRIGTQTLLTGDRDGKKKA